MGLLTGLLTLPLAPVRGVVWIAEQVQAQAEAEQSGRGALARRLAEIEAAYEAGELTEQQRAELESAALAGLPVADGGGG
ncbi:MAG TPA: gas vesicle protein GvpG [Natronosporangium sp.]